MKTVSFISLLFLVGNALGQDCPPAGISTNPTAPVDPFFLNNVINPVNPSQPFTINPFLNGFDWGKIAGADFKTIGIDLCTYWEFDNSIVLANPGDPCPRYYPMVGFMSDAMPTQFNYLKQPQDNAFITHRDYHWEDGWELLWMNLGYLPDGTSIAGPHAAGSPFNGNNYSATPDNIPYFIIYNRYRGTLRLVANVWDNRIKHQNLQVRIIQTGGTGNLTGILRAVENYDRPLSMTTNTAQVISPRFQSVRFNQWMVADFQMAYDPCTCISKGKFDIEFMQFNEMDVDIIGREISFTQQIDESNYTLNDFMNLSDLNPNEYKPGTMIYRSLQDMISQYRDKLDKYDQEMNDYNSVGNQLIRQALNQGENILGVFLPDSLEKANIGKNLKKAFAKGLDFAAMEFLPKHALNKPAKPTTPSATYSETAFKGTIGSTYVDAVGPLYMPGTFPASYGGVQPALTPFNYPAYNEVLGQFALLQKPKFKRALDENTKWYTCLHFGSGWCNAESTNPGSPTPGYNYTYFESEHRQTISLKLAEDLKFAFNPALDFNFDATSVEVAFVLTFKGMSGVNDADLRIQRTVTGTDFTMAHWFRPCANQGNCTNTMILETDWYTARDMMGKVFNGEIVTTANGDEAAGFAYQTYHPDNIKLTLEKIEMKVLVDMYFEMKNSRGQYNNSTQVLTYLLWERTTGSSPFEPTGSAIGGDFGSYSDVIHFKEITLGPWTNFINGSDAPYFSVKADKVRVNSTLQNSGNSGQLSYGIDARKQIRLVPGARLKPNGRLRIIPDPLAQFGLPASTAYIADYCQGTVTEPYMGNRASISAQSQIVKYEDEVAKRKKILAASSAAVIQLNPNPTSGLLQITSSNQPITQIEVYDLSGRRLYHRIFGESENKQVQINLSALSNGVYVVKTTSGEQVSTKKFVVGR
jgi:hypothetical protein